MFRLSKLDALLLFMALIWGTNYTVIKFAFREVPPQAFNAVRMILASLVMLATMVITRRLQWNPGEVFYTRHPVTRRDWTALAGLGFEPVRSDSTVTLRNCPFHPLAAYDPELVCAMNQAYVSGLLDGLEARTLTAVLAPLPGGCCVRLEPGRDPVT